MFSALKLVTNNHYVFHFDSDSVQMNLNACATKGLKCFKYNFLPDMCFEKIVSTATNKSPAPMLGHRITSCRITDDHSRHFHLSVLMNYSQDCKFLLLSPKWIKKFERSQDIPPKKRTRACFEEEFCVM